MNDPPQDLRRLRPYLALGAWLILPSGVFLWTDLEPPRPALPPVTRFNVVLDEPFREAPRLSPLGWLVSDGFVRVPSAEDVPREDHLWPMPMETLISHCEERVNEIFKTYLARASVAGMRPETFKKLNVRVDLEQRVELAVLERGSGRIAFGVEPLLRAIGSPTGSFDPGLMDDRADAFTLAELLSEDWARDVLAQAMGPVLHPLLFRGALAASTGLPRETLEEEVAVRLFSVLHLRRILGEQDGQSMGLRAYDSAMRRALGEPEGGPRWYLDPLPASFTGERLDQEMLAARELSLVAVNSAVPEMWRVLRTAAGGTEALRASIVARRPDLDRLSQDWPSHVESLRAQAQTVRQRLAIEGDQDRRRELARRAEGLEAHALADEPLARDPERVRTARRWYRGETWNMARVVDGRQPTRWLPTQVADRLTTAYLAFFSAGGGARWGVEAARGLLKNDVTLDLDDSPGRLAAFVPGSGEIRIGVTPFLRKFTANGVERTPQPEEIDGFSQRMIRTWDEVPETLEAFAAETAPAVFHELSHAALTAQVALPFQAVEEEVAVRLRTVLYLREKLRADPRYLDLRGYDRRMRERIGGERGDGEWWRDPLDPAAGLPESPSPVEELNGSFHPHVPTLWRDLRVAAGGAAAMRANVSDLGLESLEQDWGAHVKALAGAARMARTRQTRGILVEHRRKDEDFLRNRTFLEQSRAFYRQELARLDRELQQ